jgi:hypothetical protein
VLWISRRRLKAVESWEQLLSSGGDVPAVISLDKWGSCFAAWKRASRSRSLAFAAAIVWPLHVRGAVGSASLKGLNMSDYITLTRTRSLTGGWARVGLHEIMLSLRAPLNSSATVAR